ncbi:MAG: hypothetical protein ABJP48_00620 [Erythrobacter sp.]
MRSIALFALALAALGPAAAQEASQTGEAPRQQAEPARQVVEASAPNDLSVTIYRDPNRQLGQEINISWPRGFAMISETRTVTLPAGRSTIRFDGVAEGMVGVSAIVTGLPGGTIEKNRNAELLSPAALVNGSLGNRVTITRTNPATGEEVATNAVVRTRADGGLVLQSGQDYEAVRCAGLPERLTFDGVPAGLSANPVFSIDTQDTSGGTYEVTLTYLAWGFDWQANYVATLTGPEGSNESRNGDAFNLHLLSWLTVLNDNGQSFDDAELLVIAGTLNVESDFEELAEAPVAQPLRLTCYPIGSTAAGSPVNPVASGALGYESDRRHDQIVVTAQRVRSESVMDIPVSFTAVAAAEVLEATEEQLGDLKLYRVPERVNVSAQGLKQIAFLNRHEVEGRYLYRAYCSPYDWQASGQSLSPAGMLLVTKNEAEMGLGIALPQGAMSLFEPSMYGPQLVAQTDLRDYAEGQDVELAIGDSNQVFAQCNRESAVEPDDEGQSWINMRTNLNNANSHEVRIRMVLGESGEWDVRWPRARSFTKDGEIVVELTLAANSTREFDWRMRRAR